jgi:hypothetical protein
LLCCRVLCCCPLCCCAVCCCCLLRLKCLLLLLLQHQALLFSSRSCHFSFQLLLLLELLQQ